MSKVAKYSDDASAVLSQMLSAVIAYSTCCALAKFEQTGSSTKRKVMFSMMRYDTIAKSKLISNDARESAAAVQWPNSVICHMAETQRCMICEQTYHGGFHPDFGLYAHNDCIKPLLVTGKSLLQQQYPLKMLLKEYPFTNDKNPQFLNTRKAGFPNKWAICDIPKWRKEHEFDTGVQQMVDYNKSNSKSARTVKQEHQTQWNDQLGQCTRSLGMKGKTIASLLKMVPQGLHHTIKEDLQTMRTDLVPAANAIQYMLDAHALVNKGYDIQVLNKMLMSAEPSEWLQIENLSLIFPDIKKILASNVLISYASTLNDHYPYDASDELDGILRAGLWGSLTRYFDAL